MSLLVKLLPHVQWLDGLGFRIGDRAKCMVRINPVLNVTFITPGISYAMRELLTVVEEAVFICRQGGCGFMTLCFSQRLARRRFHEIFYKEKYGVFGITTAIGISHLSMVPQVYFTLSFTRGLIWVGPMHQSLQS